MTAPVIPEQRLPEQRERSSVPGQRAAVRAAGRDGLGEGITGREYGNGKRKFRTDIQGLRAIAVLVVVLYHCGVAGFSGGYVGVDVFFVISGFLITQHLLTEVDTTKKVSISGFYSRRIRRLLPPALLVVAVTVLVARFYGPVLQSTRTATDGLFAIFYGMNYRLADQGIDYQAANAAPSPLQHFWSLAVEEQFYVFWPLILMVFAFLTRRLGSVARRSLLVPVLVAIIAVSLHASITTTADNGPLAYYSLHTRAWELGVGALVAAAVPLFLKTPTALAAVITWIGLGLLLAPVFLFDDATAFPGYLAAIPVVGTALVIAAGLAAPRNGVDRVLHFRPVQFVGHVSYGWYLWHWPAIILGPVFFVDDFGTIEKVEMAILALWFATLSYLIIEQPTLRVRIPVRRWLGVGVAISLVVAGTAGAAIALAPKIQGNGGVAAELDFASPTAVRLTAALRAGATTGAVPANLTPGLEDAAGDRSVASADGCLLNFVDVEQPACVYGDKDADRTILLFGDSHADHWFGAINAYAKRNGYRLVEWTKSACPIADVVLFNPQIGRDYTECGTWREQRLAAISEMKPELIVASQANSLPGKSYADSTWAAQTAKTMRSLADSSEQLVYLGDPPHPNEDVPTCVSENLDQASNCNLTLDPPAEGSVMSYLPGRNQAVFDGLVRVDVTTVDTQRWFCTAATCPVVVGNVLVYRDDSHITQAFSKALEPLLRDVFNKLGNAKGTGKS